MCLLLKYYSSGTFCSQSSSTSSDAPWHFHINNNKCKHAIKHAHVVWCMSASAWCKLFCGVSNTRPFTSRCGGMFLRWSISGSCSQCCRSFWTTALWVQHKLPLNSSESPWLLFFLWLLHIKASFQLYFRSSFPLLCNHAFAVATKCQSHGKIWLITPFAYVPKPPVKLIFRACCVLS